MDEEKTDALVLLEIRRRGMALFQVSQMPGCLNNAQVSYKLLPPVLGVQRCKSSNRFGEYRVEARNAFAVDKHVIVLLEESYLYKLLPSEIAAES